MPGKSNVLELPARRVLQKVASNRRRKTDAEYGRDERKYLRPTEVEALIRAAKDGRHGARDALVISLAYHHGLRVTELIELKWDAIDLKAGTIKVSRKKGGIGGVQHLTPADARALRALRYKRDGSPIVFVTERDGMQMTRDAFAKQLAAAGARAGLDRRLCHPHALRHAAGHALANSGRVNEYQLQAVMGHRDPRSTRIYVQGVAGLIRGLWD
jgi:type 1 fimbriae regulatory protein FimB/type 1 fimbriae regulatory protein FimE